MTFIAGPYTYTLAASSLGISEDGFRLRIANRGDAIRGDNLGASIQDFVYRGADLTLETTLQEYDAAGAQSAFWPYDAVLGEHGQAGILASSVAGALVLTAVAGTTAAAAPASLTGTLSVLPPDFNVDLLFAARLRNVPLQFQLLPTGSPVAWFTTT